MRHKISFLLLALALVACAPNKLTVHTEYITQEFLASYHVDTPDPLLLNPPIGQRLVIQWVLPRQYRCLDDLHLHVKIRFRNRQEISFDIPLNKLIGFYCYELLNEEFCKTKGILTYKIDLMGGGEVLDEWRHQLWAELIEINQT